MKIMCSNNENKFIISKEEKPCVVCKKLTKQIEIHFESRLCSDECLTRLEKQYMESLSKEEFEDQL